MIPSLPTELLRLILEQVRGDLDLANCCSTSKSFLHLARPLLYSTVRFFVRDWDDDYIPGVSYSLTDLLNESTFRLAHRLATEPHLQILVRRVVFSSDESDKFRMWTSREDLWKDGDRELSRLITRLSSLEEIVLQDPFRFDKVDELLKNCQASLPSSSRECLTSPLHLVRERQPHDNPDAYKLHASYTSLEFRGMSAFYTYAASTLLVSSLCTLQHLSIPFDETALLPNYSRLKHLELIFLLPDSPYIELQSTVQELYNSLPKLPALETLVLSDSIQPDLPTPFPTEPLSYSLPPTLTSLSLEGHFVPSDLSGFIRTLPQSSKLARLNVKGNEEESLSEGELEVECAKRGIRLTFDDVWENKL